MSKYKLKNVSKQGPASPNSYKPTFFHSSKSLNRNNLMESLINIILAYRSVGDLRGYLARAGASRARLYRSDRISEAPQFRSPTSAHPMRPRISTRQPPRSSLLSWPPPPPSSVPPSSCSRPTPSLTYKPTVPHPKIIQTLKFMQE